MHAAQPIDEIRRLVRVRGRVRVRVRGRGRVRVRPIDEIRRLCAERSNRGHRSAAHECLGKG